MRNVDYNLHKWHKALPSRAAISWSLPFSGHRSSQASFHVSFPLALPAPAAQKQRAHLAGCLAALPETQPCLPVPLWPFWVFWSCILTQKTADVAMAASGSHPSWTTACKAALHVHPLSKGRCHTKLSSSMDFAKCSSSWCTQVFSWQWVASGNPSALGVATSKHISFCTFPSP